MSLCDKMIQQEEQKVIEAKIRMRQQELQDDEEREKRRIEGRVPTPRAPPSAVAPIDDDWGTANRHRQVPHPCHDPNHPLQIYLKYLCDTILLYATNKTMIRTGVLCEDFQVAAV